MIVVAEIIGAVVLILAAGYGIYRAVAKLTAPSKTEEGKDRWTEKSPPDES